MTNGQPWKVGDGTMSRAEPASGNAVTGLGDGACRDQACEPFGAHAGATPTHSLRAYVGVVLDALEAGTAERGGPLPAGGPAAVAARTRQAMGIIGDPVGVAGVPDGGPARSPTTNDHLVGGRPAPEPSEDRIFAASADPHTLRGSASVPDGLLSQPFEHNQPGGTPAGGCGHAGGSSTGVLPEDGIGARQALADLTRALAAGAADPADPACAAHLHCPPLAVAVAADLAVSALNPSLDSWDQAPGATTVETEVIAALAGLVGFDPALAVGTMTTGGTESNLMGLLLARDATADAGRLRVFCSRAAHFSVSRAAVVLGLAPGAVVPVDTDAAHRMDPRALCQVLSAHSGPAAVVATAGTTDAGAVDPLPDITAIAREHRAWLHVDAAYGGGALFSDRLRGLLTGIGDADSVALDLHKLGWQPVPAGAFLTRDATPWGRLDTEVAYLNPADDTEAGLGSLLGRSLRTTRRPDAFALAVTLRALGRRRLGALVDACHDLALHAAATVVAHPRLELSVPVTLTTVVFRYRAPSGTPASTDNGGSAGSAGNKTVNAVNAVNAELRRRLLVSGRAVVGRTEIGVDREVHLKLTLLNPAATTQDVDALLGLVVAAGDAVARWMPTALARPTGCRWENW